MNPSMKVKGLPRSDGSKDYSIVHEGEEYTAIRNGSLFLCNGVTGTLREIKQSIQDGVISIHQHEPNPCEGISDSWECVPPATLVALMLSVSLKGSELNIFDECLRTLDCYGFIKENGAVDKEEALRIYNKFKEKRDET